MKRRLRAWPLAWCGVLAAMAFAVAPTKAQAQTSFVAGLGGVIRITPIFHATVQLEYNGRVIIIDPVSAGSYSKKADLVLVTDIHPDHLDMAAINKVRKAAARVVVPGAALENVRLMSGHPYVTMANDETKTVGGVRVEAVPMYNLQRGPQPGQKFHTKGRGNGYVITLGGKRIYIAGDTEATPEMKALRKIDVAFLPMNLPYTMTPQEAAQGARAFKPRIVFPYHYRAPFNKANANPQQFRDALRGTRIQVRLLNWYPAQAVARAMAAR